MSNQRKYLFLDRKHAFRKLSSRFNNFENQDCSVIAISNGALPIAIRLSMRLNADLIFIPSLKIEDPGSSSRSIGVVGFDYTVVETSSRDIPQDYIIHKVRTLRSKLRSRYPGIYRPIGSGVQNKNVIVVDDMVQTSDEVLALLKTIRKLQPKQVVVAFPAITHGAARAIGEKADVSIFFHLVTADMIKWTYLNFNSIADEEAVDLLSSPTKVLDEDELPIKSKLKAAEVDSCHQSTIDNERSKALVVKQISGGPTISHLPAINILSHA